MRRAGSWGWGSRVPNHLGLAVGMAGELLGAAGTSDPAEHSPSRPGLRAGLRPLQAPGLACDPMDSPEG